MSLQPERIASATLHIGDCLDVLPQLAAEGFRAHAVVTDPPYHLKSISRARPDLAGADNPYARRQAQMSGGFMGQQWDGGDVAFRPETWRAVRDCMLPGAHLVAFGGTRTFHRMVCAIEDAGFEIRDTLMWVYGSGFPKSLDVSKAIDRAAGAEREVVGTKLGRPGMARDGSNQRSGFDDAFGGDACGHLSTDITAPATPEAAAWAGWHTALKPSYEPIILARRPLSEGTVAANVLRHGTGAINVDISRVMTADQEQSASAYRRLSSLYYSACNLSVSASCALDALQCVASALRSCSIGDKAPSRSGGGQCDKPQTPFEYVSFVALLFPNGVWCGQTAKPVQGSLADCPAYHRFCDEYSRRVEAACRDGAPSLLDVLGDIFPALFGHTHIHESRHNARLSIEGDSGLLCALLAVLLGAVVNPTTYSAPPKGRYPANLLTDGSPEVEQAFAAFGMSHGNGAYVQPNPTQGAVNTYGKYGVHTPFHIGDTGSASRFFYTAKADARDRAGSKHPCVKPSSLMRWLVRLVCPEGGTILDPFAGTGSTGLAADQCGMRSVLIERDAQYVEDIKRKLSADAPLFAEASPVPDLDAAYQRHGDLFADAAD